MENEIVSKVKEFAVTLLERRLPEHLYFHNLCHTQEVVEAVTEIGNHSGLSAEELHTVIVAAWFHDTGYCNTYSDHEIEGANISHAFLTLLGVPEKRIATVSSCILATKFPQQPKNKLEEILCDADFYHFSRTDYPAHAQALRKEWEIHLHLKYTDQEWNKLNYEMLKSHRYFTVYGQTVLQERKKENIKNLEKE